MQYALLVSASGVAGRLLGGVSGVVAKQVGWSLFFFTTMLLVLPASALLLRLRSTIQEADSDRNGP
jgi:ABC-type dipeptide/oligopeptide/nickel transport system permease subunit